MLSNCTSSVVLNDFLTVFLSENTKSPLSHYKIANREVLLQCECSFVFYLSHTVCFYISAMSWNLLERRETVGPLIMNNVLFWPDTRLPLQYIFSVIELDALVFSCGCDCSDSWQILSLPYHVHLKCLLPITFMKHIRGRGGGGRIFHYVTAVNELNRQHKRDWREKKMCKNLFPSLIDGLTCVYVFVTLH